MSIADPQAKTKLDHSVCICIWWEPRPRGEVGLSLRAEAGAPTKRARSIDLPNVCPPASQDQTQPFRLHLHLVGAAASRRSGAQPSRRGRRSYQKSPQARPSEKTRLPYRAEQATPRANTSGIHHELIRQ